MPDTEQEQVHLIPPIGNKKVKARKEAFCKFINENKQKPFIICAHDNPDPDALASAYGVYRILSFLGVDSIQMFYCGEISHPQNRAMKTVLKIPINVWTKPIENEFINANEKPIFVFVDCVGNQKNMSIPFDPQIVIDHHKTIPGKGILAIHDEIGACSTLVVDLMLSLSLQEDDIKVPCFDPDTDDMKEIATALAVGIKTDTLDFLTETTTDEDFQAYKILSRHFSDEKFHKIVNYELPPYVFDAEQTAWENKNYQPPNLIAGLGFLDDSKSDCIPYLADKFMRLQGIQTVVVYAIVDGAVRGSVRTSSSTLDAQNLLDELFGQGNGGAKHGIGGAKVHINVFDVPSMPEDEMTGLWDLVKTNIQRKFQKITEK
jgi:nanoRNase/pAp phosphatase (c-di-AMP/oligoRNAs hydrolase)